MHTPFLVPYERKTRLKVWLLSFAFTSLFMFLTPCSLYSQTKGEESPTVETLFNQGLSFYQNKKYPESIQNFQKALQLDPNNVATLTNLGLASLKNDQKGWAAAYLRRALTLDHNDSLAQKALQETLSKVEVKELPRTLSLFESLREQHLRFWSLDLLLILCLVSFFICAWKALTYVGDKKRSRESESAPPGWPLISAFSAVAFVLFLTLTLFKIHDSFALSRGTIIVKKTNVLSAPQANQTSLFEAFEGMEVLVLGTSGDYFHVKYPGGFSGWIEKSHLYRTQ